MTEFGGGEAVTTQTYTQSSLLPNQSYLLLNQSYLLIVNKSAEEGECEQVNNSSVHVYFIPFYVLVFLLGLVLNGFTLKVFVFRSGLVAPSCVTVYLKNLALSDFLLTLCLPLRITSYVMTSLPLRKVYCTYGASAFYLNMYASIMFMGYIAANRYLKIVHPLGTYTQTVEKARRVSMVTWIFLLTITLTYIALMHTTQTHTHAQTHTHTITHSVTCESLHSEQMSLFYKLIHTCSALVFLFVLCFLIFFYYHISRRISHAQVSQPASVNSSKLSKARRKMLVLVSVFCICFVPYHLVRINYMFLKKFCDLVPFFFYLKEITLMLSVLNVCLDPLVYFIFCKAFRVQLSMKKSVRERRRRRRSVIKESEEEEERRSDGRRKMSLMEMNRKLSLTTHNITAATN